jgi:hypothetical protein
MVVVQPIPAKISWPPNIIYDNPLNYQSKLYS